MKELFVLTLSMFLLFSCNTRHKVKHTEKTEAQTETNTKVEKYTEFSENQQENQQFLDSTRVNQFLKTSYFGESNLLNFTLKSNGNQIENSPIRFVIITDNQGNKTEIPVNDNTELIFNNEKKNQRGNINSKIEENHIIKNDIEQKSVIESQEKRIKKEQLKTQNISARKDTEVKTERLSFWIPLIFIAVFFMALTRKR